MPENGRYELSAAERAFIERKRRLIEQLEAELAGALMLIAEQQRFRTPYELTRDLCALEAVEKGVADGVA
jgi:hypothetical protein